MIRSTEDNNTHSGDISLKEIILKMRDWWYFLLSKWVIILIAAIIGGSIGLAYAWSKNAIYKAELSFVLQDEKSNSGGLSSAMGLATQFGIDLGGSKAGGQFSGDNILVLMKSRTMVEKALLTPINNNGKQISLADYYINFNGLRESWKGNPLIENVHFLPGADRSKFTLQQDSLLGIFHRSLVKGNLLVDKPDKSLSIITLKVSSIDQIFSKNFAEALVKVVSDFYVQTKTEKQAKNVAILQRQTDSVRRILNAAISGVATSVDINPNPNPLLQSLRVPSQRRQVDVTNNTVILNGLFSNLEMAKMSLLQETPLISIIDKPVFPLEKEKMGRSTGLVLGAVISVFLAVMCILIKYFFDDIMSKN